MYQSFIGLEIHIHLLTKSKVFCGCRAAFGQEPNTNICPVCMGMPGVLPALNEEAIKMGYLVARALNCRLSGECLFERKNYFYPDMPKNYQISQFGAPLGEEGFLDIEFHKRKKRVRIREVHLEEDAGKMIHAGDMSLLDYNRAGTPLLEIVTQPDLEVGEEAELFLQHFRRLVRYLEVCDGNMEEGSLRCDANVSINPEGLGLGSKVEIKNLNSFKFVRKALNFEIERQQEVLDRGGEIIQETRLWNENRDVTASMRSKESAHDYRYFPEPDLPPFRPNQSFLDRVEQALVELPQDRRRRFIDTYAISEGQADFLCAERESADFFEQTIELGGDPDTVALWMAADVRKLLNRTGSGLNDSPLSPGRLAELLTLLKEKRIHGRIAKQTLEAIFMEDNDPLEIIRERDWEQITDSEEIRSLVGRVMEEHPQAVHQIRAGDSKPIGFLIGHVMRMSAGRAEPGVLKVLLQEQLNLSVIQVLSMGGAITAQRSENGDIVPGALETLVEKLAHDLPNTLRLEEIEISQILSEEITPQDWAALIHRLADILNRQKSPEGITGIVITHGTDTLAYTAALLFWLFPDPSLPVVLTASLSPEDSADSFRAAVLAASGKAAGIYVAFGQQILPALNLKFEKVAIDGFKNWNLDHPVFSSGFLGLPYARLQDTELTVLLEQAISCICILKVYPGMRGDMLIALMRAGIRYFILELYDTGTANLRETPFSLRKAFLEGRERGVRFFCTSQQEGIVDFSSYVTSHELWREGAVPMGSLTTESAYSRLLAALLNTDRDDEILTLMEQANEDITFRG